MTKNSGQTDEKPSCKNCGHSPEDSALPFLKCKTRNAYFPRHWHCGKWFKRPITTEKTEKTEKKP